MSSRLHLQTKRLRLRPLCGDDVWFLLRLFNEPSFLENIGDRGLKTPEQAALYLEQGPGASYVEHGDGLLAVERRGEPAAVGICGLVRREGLDAPDLGFAFLPEVFGRGFATEASEAVLASCRGTTIGRVLAVTGVTNAASMRVLAKLGFEPLGRRRLPGDSEQVELFELVLASASAD
ncbi:MAG: GNAT family N-acetyltransferase [Acidobacteriota bacterium]